MLCVGGVNIRIVEFKASSLISECWTCSLVGSGESGPKIFSSLTLIFCKSAVDSLGVVKRFPGDMRGIKSCHSAAVWPRRLISQEKLWHLVQVASIFRISLSLPKAEIYSDVEMSEGFQFGFRLNGTSIGPAPISL